MSKTTDTLANVTFWSVLLVSSGASFYAGFYYTHSATANVPVKQPVHPIPVTPVRRPTEKPSPQPTPQPSPSLIPGPIPVSVPPEAAVPEPTLLPEADEAGFQTPPPIRSGGVTEEGGAPGEGNLVYRVQVGAFDTREGAQRQVEMLQAQGLNAVVVWDGGSYRAQLGAFSDRTRAFYVADEINARGFAVTVRR